MIFLRGFCASSNQNEKARWQAGRGCLLDRAKIVNPQLPLTGGSSSRDKLPLRKTLTVAVR
jgi:hypothetical protein